MNIWGTEIFGRKEIAANYTMDPGSLPVVEEKRPRPDTYETTAKYVKWGKLNQYPNFLKELYDGSTLHKRCINGKAKACAGDKITFTGENDADVKAAQEYFKNLKIPKLHQKICLQVALYGGFWPRLVFQAKAGEKFDMNISEVYLPDVLEMRSAKKEYDYGTGRSITREHFSHRTWRGNVQLYDKVKNPKGYIPIPVYHAGTFEELKKDPRNQVSCYFTLGSNLEEYYGLPDYHTDAGIDAIEIDIKIINFDKSDVSNGLNAGYIITFFREDFSESDPEKEDRMRKYEVKLVQERLVGSENVNRVVIQRALPSETDKKTVDITEIPSNNNEGRHLTIDTRKNLYILVAHGIVAPELIGIPNLSESGFSSQADRIIAASEIMMLNTISELQEPVLEFYQMLLDDFAGLQDKVTVGIANSSPVSKLISEDMWKYAFTENEFREYAGWDAMDDAQLAQLRMNRNSVKTSASTTKPVETPAPAQKPSRKKSK
jgi:hypothetical protein